MNNGGYEIFYGGPNMTGEASPYSWADAVKVIKFTKQNKQIKYIFCIGPYGGGRRLIYRALRGVPGWCAASHCRWKHLLDFPMQTGLDGPAEVLGRRIGAGGLVELPPQIESD